MCVEEESKKLNVVSPIIVMSSVFLYSFFKSHLGFQDCFFLKNIGSDTFLNFVYIYITLYFNLASDYVFFLNVSPLVFFFSRNAINACVHFSNFPCSGFIIIFHFLNNILGRPFSCHSFSHNINNALK